MSHHELRGSEQPTLTSRQETQQSNQDSSRLNAKHICKHGRVENDNIIKSGTVYR